MKKILVILGPTATGKTTLALKLAKQFEGELIACDSRQVYKGLDIGTGKDNANAWMYDVVDPKQQYSVSDYIKAATKIIEHVLLEDKLPIVVGGTGLYLKALLGDLGNIRVPINPKLRGELAAFSIGELQTKLKARSPITWKKMTQSDKQNKRRLLRSIELVNMYGHTNIKTRQKTKAKKWNTLKIGLTAPRPFLNQKIDVRLDARVKQGLIEEGRKLLKSGLSTKRMRQLGLEYGVLANLLKDEINQQQFISILKIKIHQFAKRQMTWFKKYEADARWFDISKRDYQKEIVRLVKKWYDSQNAK